jgi:hypothetical protein
VPHLAQIAEGAPSPGFSPLEWELEEEGEAWNGKRRTYLQKTILCFVRHHWSQRVENISPTIRYTYIVIADCSVQKCVTWRVQRPIFKLNAWHQNHIVALLLIADT